VLNQAAIEAVLSAAGNTQQPTSKSHRPQHPGGLTRREAQVLRTAPEDSQPSRSPNSSTFHPRPATTASTTPIQGSGYRLEPPPLSGRCRTAWSVEIDARARGHSSFAARIETSWRGPRADVPAILELTTQLPTLEAPPPPLQQLLGAMRGNQEAMNAFVIITAGTVSPVEFFDPDHLGSIVGATAAR
jgi:hypothetical protein